MWSRRKTWRRRRENFPLIAETCDQVVFFRSCYFKTSRFNNSTACSSCTIGLRNSWTRPKEFALHIEQQSTRTLHCRPSTVLNCLRDNYHLLAKSCNNCGFCFAPINNPSSTFPTWCVTVHGSQANKDWWSMSKSGLRQKQSFSHSLGHRRRLLFREIAAFTATRADIETTVEIIE